MKAKHRDNALLSKGSIRSFSLLALLVWLVSGHSSIPAHAFSVLDLSSDSTFVSSLDKDVSQGHLPSAPLPEDSQEGDDKMDIEDEIEDECINDFDTNALHQCLIERASNESFQVAILNKRTRPLYLLYSAWRSFPA